MSLTAKDRRKSCITNTNTETRKLSVKSNEIRRNSSEKLTSNETSDVKKKSDYPVTGRNHRRSDADLHDKTSSEPYVRECKDFAGVTIIFRTAPNSKTFGYGDGRGRNNLQETRRKSEIPQAQTAIQEKIDHGDKLDHTGPTGSDNVVD